MKRNASSSAPIALISNPAAIFDIVVVMSPFAFRQEQTRAKARDYILPQRFG